jgi:cytochrome b6-f complex iron-sulfur subunit
MADKKLTTEEILAKLRKQDAGGDGAGAVESAGQPAADEVSEASASRPSSTADILAAARAQAGGVQADQGAEQPAAAKPAAGASPSSTADILAAARSQGGSGSPAKQKPAGGKPSSTADILAAARSQGGGAPAGGAATKPAAKEGPTPKKAAPAAGERPSVAEMVKAAREGKPMQEAGAKPAKPKLPSKPPLPKVKKPEDDSTRRGFLVTAITTLCTPYYLAWSVLALIGGVWSLAVARFMMPNMIVEPPTKFKIGPPSDYPAGTVSTKWKAERGIWVVNTDSYDGRNLVYALASVCTHLGCTPNWLEGEQKFKCPCHGSGFYINGINFEGPAPRPLERVGLRLAEDGSLEVDKSVKFQEELGQWQDPNSFVELS